MQTILIDMATHPTTVPTFSQSDTTRSLFGSIKLDEFSFLNWFRIQLREHFFVVARCHLINLNT